MQNANLGRICVSRMALNESIKSTLFVYVLFYYYYNRNSRPRYHGDRGWNKSFVPINMNPFLPFPFFFLKTGRLEFLTIWRITQTSYFGAVLFSDSILVWSAHACTNIPISVRTQTPKLQLNLTIRQPPLYRHLSRYTATRFVPLK